MTFSYPTQDYIYAIPSQFSLFLQQLLS